MDGSSSSSSSSSSMLSRTVEEFVRKEVADWDDEVMATARFKAFSGQRSDWEPKYAFWRDLILKVATHLDVFFFHPSEVLITSLLPSPPSNYYSTTTSSEFINYWSSIY